MDDKQLIDAIRTLTALKQVTLGEIERALKMPQNCLSGMLNGLRNLSSKKWRPLLEAYVNAKMNGLTEIVIPIGEKRIPSDIKEKIDNNNLPENKARILMDRESINPLPANKMQLFLAPEELIDEPAKTSSKTPPPGLSKSQQIRWHREHNQTLK